MGYATNEPFDPELKRLQDEWHRLRDIWRNEGFPSASQARREFYFHHDKLADYLWKKAERIVDADRAKHPKAKRNAPAISIGGHGRHLP